MVTYRIRILIFEFGNRTSLVVTDGQTNYEKFINGLLLMKGNVGILETKLTTMRKAHNHPKKKKLSIIKMLDHFIEHQKGKELELQL